MSTTSNQALPSQAALKVPTAQTLALRQKLSHFIDKGYAFLKTQEPADTGKLATPEVVNVVKADSTAFHCNASGTVDLLWVRKDITLEALDKPAVAYWSGLAGPGPKHEQREQVRIHGVPEQAMKRINKDPSNVNLLAHFLFPWFNFWSLCQYHILIWIACIIFSGSTCILLPTLLVVESTKITRLLLDDMLVNVFVTGITRALFDAFILGNFDMDFLVAICITVTVVVWKEMPQGPETWIHCYGIPVVINYGPLSHHCGIAIPKQHPYRPYHTVSLAYEYVELDRAARVMIELARKVVAAAPPPPTDETRRMYMVRLRLLIVEQAVKRGYWKKLEDAKEKVKVRQAAFFHLKSTSAEDRIAEDGLEAQAARKESRVAAGQQASKSRKASAIRAEGAKGSSERIAWAKRVINDLRRKAEEGKTVGLLACPRNMVHGTLEHAAWLIHRVDEGADVIGSASGYEQLETPKTEEDQDARAIRQDAAGSAAGMSSNIRECTVSEALQRLASDTLVEGTGPKRAVELAQCPHCQATYLMHDPAGQATHTCMVMRSYVLPMLFADHQERLRQQKADKEVEADDNATEDDLHAIGVTRASFNSVFPWVLYEDVLLGDDWAQIRANKPVAYKRPKRSFTMKDPLWQRCLDRAGRLSRLCLNLTKITTPGQLLSLPIAKELFDDEGNPKAVDGIEFLELKTIIQQYEQALLDLGIEFEKLETARQAPAREKVFFAVIGSKAAKDRAAFLAKQVATHFDASQPKLVATVVTRSDIEAAYLERMSLRLLRPTKFDWNTGEDGFRPLVTASPQLLAADSAGNYPPTSK